MFASVKKWGNSYAIRVTKADLQRLGVKPGQEIEFSLRALPAKVDLSALPTFRSKETLEQARQASADERIARWSRASR